MGVTAGFLGSAAFYFQSHRPYVLIFIGSLMVIFSLILFGMIRKLEKYFLTFSIINKFFKKKVSGLIESDKPINRFYVGIFNGFFPCGLSYAAIISSLSSGSLATGGAGMLLSGAPRMMKILTTDCPD